MAVIQKSPARGFVLIWAGITMIVGIATFVGIYLGYDAENSDLFGQNSVDLPIIATNTPEEVAQVSTNTATIAPTDVPTNTPVPTNTTESEEQATEEDDGQAVAQVQEEQAPPTPAPTALPVSDRSFQLAVQVQPVIDGNPDVQRIWMNDVQNLGLQWYKQQVRWAEIELEPGVFNWDRVDLSLNMASEYGFNVLASIVAAPEWARPEGVTADREGPPADTSDFTNFLTELLNRYPGQIHAIEVWNEQNLDREWDVPSGLSATGYVDFLRESFETIKNIDPGIIVISGALSPTGGLVENGVDRAIDDFNFMDQMIEAGLLNYTDCVGAHHNGINVPPDERWDALTPDDTITYTGPWENPHHSWSFRSTLESYANSIELAGGDQPLCITEFGWPSTEDLDGTPEGFGFANDNSLQEQAEYTIQAINLMQEWGFVWIASIWNLNYGPQIGWNAQNDNTPYSLIGPDWVQRPLYQAVVEWTSEQNANQ